MRGPQVKQSPGQGRQDEREMQDLVERQTYKSTEQ